ncbi:MAG TPA: FUSC family protein, partial [Mycobacterium sp.]
MIKGLTLRPAMPDIAAVLRSLLGVVAVTLFALYWGPPGSATATAVAAAVAGATALRDSPRGRIFLVVGVSLLMGSAVLLGALTSAYSALFVVVVALWSFGAATPWALGVHAGSIAAVSAALVVVAAPEAPTTSSTLGAFAVVVAGGLVQAGLIAVWPQRRWRVQRDALTATYRSLAADARKLAADGTGELASPASPRSAVDTEPLIA